MQRYFILHIRLNE